MNIRNVKTKRERQLAHALRHAIEWMQEGLPRHSTLWYERVLADDPDVICTLAMETSTNDGESGEVAS